MKINKQAGTSDETDRVEITDFGGLDIQPDVLSRPINSWAVAQNVDLFIPGSVRKVVGPDAFMTSIPTIILDMFNYLHDSGASLHQLGIGANGHIYDLAVGTDFGSIGTVSQPWVGQFNGTASGSSVTYLIITTTGATVKWESAGGVSDLGVQVPPNAITVTPGF